jgi:hypothetical protein
VFRVASARLVVVKVRVDVGPVGPVGAAEIVSVSAALAVCGVVDESVTTKVAG